MPPAASDKASLSSRQAIRELARKAPCICGCGALAAKGHRLASKQCWGRWQSAENAKTRLLTLKQRDDVFDFRGQDHPGEARRLPLLTRLAPPDDTSASLTGSSLGSMRR